MSPYLSIALSSLTQARRRTALLASGIGLAAFFAMMLLSFLSGLEGTLERVTLALASGHVNVSGLYKPLSDRSFLLVAEPDELQERLQEELGDEVEVVERVRAVAEIVSGSGSVKAVLEGIEPSREARLAALLQSVSPAPAEGAAPNTVERMAEPSSMVLFEGQAQRLRVAVGDTVTVRATDLLGVIAAQDFTVVDVVQDLGILAAQTVFIDRASCVELFQLPAGSIGVLQLYLSGSQRETDVMERLRAVLPSEEAPLSADDETPLLYRTKPAAEEGWSGQRLLLSSWRDEIAPLSWVSALLTAIASAVLLIMLLVLSAGIANSMWLSVRERTREVGTLRALGMPRGGVVLMFLIEAGLITSAASSAGVLAGALMATAVNAAELTLPVESLRAVLMSDKLMLVPELSSGAGVVSMLCLVAMAATLWPAARAARIAPASALRET